MFRCSQAAWSYRPARFGGDQETSGGLEKNCGCCCLAPWLSACHGSWSQQQEEGRRGGGGLLASWQEADAGPWGEEQDWGILTGGSHHVAEGAQHHRGDGCCPQRHRQWLRPRRCGQGIGAWRDPVQMGEGDWHIYSHWHCKCWQEDCLEGGRDILWRVPADL